MERDTKIAIGLGVAALIGFTLWRNYGVKPKDVVILNSYYGDSSTETTNEQKELIDILKRIKTIAETTAVLNYKVPTTIETSFGKYKYIETSKGGYWTKYAEVWENFANAAGSKSCVFIVGNEIVNGKISSYDPNICVSGSQKGAVYSEQLRHDIL